MIQRYKNILIADDDSDDRDLFTEAAKALDPAINVVARRDGEQLMSYLESDAGKFDMIFLDLNMPRKNGKECLAGIKANYGLSSTPVIIYTTSLNPTDIEETYAMGASFFLRKPNSFQELKDALAIVLNGKLNTSEKTLENFVVNKKITV